MNIFLRYRIGLYSFILVVSIWYWFIYIIYYYIIYTWYIVLSVFAMLGPVLEFLFCWRFIRWYQPKMVVFVYRHASTRLFWWMNGWFGLHGLFNQQSWTTQAATRPWNTKECHFFYWETSSFKQLNPSGCSMLTRGLGKAAILPWRFSELDARHLLEKVAVLRDFWMGCTWTLNGAPCFFVGIFFGELKLQKWRSLGLQVCMDGWMG